MLAYDIIFENYARGSRLADILIRHSEQVRDKALAVARNVSDLAPDLTFIAEAAMLHDIGICETAAPRIACRGTQPYIRHGIIGRRLLEQYGMNAHALVCERHVGVGITVTDIEKQQLPLPLRDMSPVTIEEKIICYADEFFSKTDTAAEHSVEAIVASLARYGGDKVDRFMQWHALFKG